MEEEINVTIKSMTAAGKLFFSVDPKTGKIVYNGFDDYDYYNYYASDFGLKSTMIRTFIQVGELNILSSIMEFGYSIDISGHQGSMLRSDAKQVLPPAGSYSMQLYDRGKYRNASITAGETAVGWEFI